MSDTFEEWQQEATPEKAKVTVCLKRDLLLELQQVEEKLQDAQVGREGLLPDDAISSLRARVDELRDGIRKDSKTFVFQSIGRRKWKTLESEHPPTDEQIELLKPSGMVPRHNPDTFPAVAMAKTCIEPGLTVEQAQWICDELPEGVFNRIWDACMTANVVGGRDPFDPVSVTQNGTGPKSKPRSGSASRAQSS